MREPDRHDGFWLEAAVATLLCLTLVAVFTSVATGATLTIQPSSAATAAGTMFVLPTRLP